jgi:hypothetical protein
MMTEQDKQLKEILLNSAERPSHDFTDIVMQKLDGLSAAPFQYQPLVGAKLHRLFVGVFSASVAAVLVLCVLMSFSNHPPGTWIQTMHLADLDYKTILIFLLTFWIVFMINSFIQTRFPSRKVSS